MLLFMTPDNISKKIIPLLKRHKVRKAGLFGSVAKGEDDMNSDVDILVEISTDTSLLDFVGIKIELEEMLGRPVDLVEYDSIKPGLRHRILSEEIRLYG
jgi:uncharacterized protein